MYIVRRVLLHTPPPAHQISRLLNTTTNSGGLRTLTVKGPFLRTTAGRRDRSKAQWATTTEKRLELEHLARAYLRLAQQADRNTHTDVDTRQSSVAPAFERNYEVLAQQCERQAEKAQTPAERIYFAKQAATFRLLDTRKSNQCPAPPLRPKERNVSSAGRKDVLRNRRSMSGAR